MEERKRKTKVGRKLLRFPPTRFCMLLIYCWKRQLKFLGNLVSLVAQQLLCACITGDVHAVVNYYALTFLYFFFCMGWVFCILMCSWDKQYR